MTLGQKIKKRRTELALTQSALTRDLITRNMLSQIESDKVMPSFPVAKALAERLALPLPYLFSDRDDLDMFEYFELIPTLHSLLRDSNYQEALRISHDLKYKNDEIYFIIAISAFNIGRELVLKGKFLKSEYYLGLAIECASKTVYPTKDIESLVALYSELKKNIEAPLLEFDNEAFYLSYINSPEIEFYKYLTCDFSYKFVNPIFKLHLEAKQKIRMKNYSDALELLTYLVDNRQSHEYNAFVMFGVYTDLENIYRAVADYENAYRYSSKRMSMLNAFNS